MAPRRQTKKTRLVFCEGAQDKAFLDYLKLRYLRDIINVDIKRGTGGSQVHLAKEAFKKGSAYDERFLKIDGDRDIIEMSQAEQFAIKNGLTILRTTPCIERLLINILEPNKKISSWNSKQNKQYFETKYVLPKKRSVARAYKTAFPKKVLNEASKRLPELKELINIF